VFLERNTGLENKVIKTCISTIKKKTLEPVWNEQFQFQLKLDSSGEIVDSLRLEVWDVNFGVLGKKTINDFM
jgi:Ca2+-dependent lipid-binding protein